MENENTLESLERIQEQIEELLASITESNDSDLPKLLPRVKNTIVDLLGVYSAAHGKSIDMDEDLLIIFKSFVKGDASLNAVRDNIREIVYYQNCLAENRQDALPKNPEKMALRTLQHIYFYLRSRLEQEHLLD